MQPIIKGRHRMVVTPVRQKHQLKVLLKILLIGRAPQRGLAGDLSASHQPGQVAVQAVHA